MQQSLQTRESNLYANSFLDRQAELKYGITAATLGSFEQSKKHINHTPSELCLPIYQFKNLNLEILKLSSPEKVYFVNTGTGKLGFL